MQSLKGRHEHNRTQREQEALTSASIPLIHRALMERHVGMDHERNRSHLTAVNKAFGRLERPGIVMALTAQKRNRLSAAQGLSEIMTHGTELPEQTRNWWIQDKLRKLPLQPDLPVRQLL